VLVHASIVPEPFGQVVIEGMAVGTPVVATRGGGVTEIIEDGITGTLVSMGSAEEMADAVIAVLSDAERAGRMAIAARKAVLERFAITTLVPKVQDVYTDLLRTRKSGKNVHRDRIGN
jgi:glycosyltransferase involved in cell wall biosynthesis